MEEIKPGTKILVQAEVIERCRDNRPKEERGYLVRTSRGEVRAEPSEIFISLKERR